MQHLHTGNFYNTSSIMTSQTPPPSQDPQPEKKGNTDEENTHPDGTKENKTEKGDQKDDEEKHVSRNGVHKLQFFLL